MQASAATIPLDSFMVETDCPYLAPIPYRGKRNEPSHIPLIAQRIAEIRNIPVEEVGAATSAAAAENSGASTRTSG